MTPPQPVPSVDDLKNAIIESDAACFHMVNRLRLLLESGEYALVSRTDRKAAITNAVAAGMAHGSTDHDYNGAALEALARTLLHLEPQ